VPRHGHAAADGHPSPGNDVVLAEGELADAGGGQHLGRYRLSWPDHGSPRLAIFMASLMRLARASRAPRKMKGSRARC
jgi:hypothetical protein